MAVFPCPARVFCNKVMAFLHNLCYDISENKNLSFQKTNLFFSSFCYILCNRYHFYSSLEDNVSQTLHLHQIKKGLVLQMLTFETASPESTGLSSQCIINFIHRLQGKQVPMHSILLLHKDKLIAEGYYAPYTADTLHRMFSISKSFTSIAIGLLEAEGQLSLSDKICDHFPEYVSADTHPWILNMTIRDMLTMRTCHAATTYKINMQSDWVESFFQVAPTHPSGKLFHYDTSSAHTLCALVEKLAGMDMLCYLKKKLAPLGFSEESYMIKDPFGVSMGGSGLVAKPMDILKFGYLLMHEGTLPASGVSDDNTEQIRLIPAEYIRQATANLTATFMTAPLPSESCGYGYQIWRNERGGYVCYGMGGQLVICLPEYDLICVTTADTQGMAGGNQLIYDAFYEEIVDHIAYDSLPENHSIRNDLAILLMNLEISPLYGPVNSPRIERISKKEYLLLENPSDFSKLSIVFNDNSTGILRYTLRGKDCELHFGLGNLQYGTFPIYDMKYAASAAWLSENTLYIRAHIIDEYVGSVRFELTFGDNDVTVFMKKIEESLFSEFNGHLYGTCN